MELEEVVRKKIEIFKKIFEYVKVNIRLTEEDNEIAIEKLNFIEENLMLLIKNFQTFKEGNKMYIHSCMNNYEWVRLAYIAFVKHLKHSWDDNLENWRLEIYKLESASRRILVDVHNKAIAEEYPEERREQYNEDQNKIQNIINLYYPYELFDLLKTKLSETKEADLKPNELESLLDMKGVLEARFGDIDRAIQIYKDACEKVPNSFDFNYKLALLLEKNGEMDTAFKYFSKVTSDEELYVYTTLTIVRLYYLWGYYTEGLELIQTILKDYYEMGIIDDHLVSMRGYPFYSEILANLAVFAKLTKNPNLVFEEIEKAKKELKSYPFGRLEDELNPFMSGDWAKRIDHLEKELKQLKKYKSPLGYNLVLLALIRARQASSYDEAIQNLNSVKITEYDFPWLKDIVNLGKAEVANRFNKNEDEQKYQKEFFERQPLLFEPNHVFRFGLIEYQEKLKKKYQTTKRDSQTGITIEYYI
jgi:hypothetical protein